MRGQAVLEGAGLALADLGASAVVGPLAEALPRAESPRHRALIVAALVTFAEEERAQVTRPLFGALRREKDPFVAVAIRRALLELTMADLSPPDPASAGSGA